MELRVAHVLHPSSEAVFLGAFLDPPSCFEYVVFFDSAICGSGKRFEDCWRPSNASNLQS